MDDEGHMRSLVDENEKESHQQQPQQREEEEENEHVLKFLDSMDAYITLIGSLSSTLRQGWLEIASARHSMGASRISSALFDLKFHSAATSLNVAIPEENSKVMQPQFTLSKWTQPDSGKFCSEGGKYNEGELLKKSNSLPLRHRGTSAFSESQEKTPFNNGALLTANDRVQKERAKYLSVFGTLVSPKLRAAQVSFETALETLVEIANTRSSMLSAFDQVREDIEGSKG